MGQEAIPQHIAVRPWAMSLRFPCHPERSAESAKPKDPLLTDITDSSTRFARSE